MLIKLIKMRWATGGVNYSYLLSTADKTKSWLIDPAEPHEVIPALNESEINSIQAIVNTHHHYDHAGGNNEVLSQLKKLSSNPSIKVIGSSEICAAVTDVPTHLQKYKLDNLDILCIRTPCHTQDSVCYYVRDSYTEEQCIFTGDTLFTAGCGRFFEGVGSEMDDSLNNVILENVGPEMLSKTKVFPGHEYTKSNVKFVRALVYTNLNDNKSFDRLENFCNSNEITTGVFTLQDELDFNPFMRLEDVVVRKAVGDLCSKWPRSKVMDKLRELKNSM